MFLSVDAPFRERALPEGGLPVSRHYRIFEPARIGTVELPNRLLRAATFEGRCDGAGAPLDDYVQLYAELAKLGLGGIITGFAFVNRSGRAMQPGQAGLDSDALIPAFRRVTEAVHANGGRIFLQLAHAGRQTSAAAAGGCVYGASARKSRYFNARPTPLSTREVEETANAFAHASRRAQQAGFDGVQVHAAHGYLVHQFLHPLLNDRTDEYGVDQRRGLGVRFLGCIIERIRALCDRNFPLLVKVSAGDDYHRALGETEFRSLITYLDGAGVDAIEVSYGTMDHALNIFRGGIPVDEILDVNPRYRTRSVLKRFLFKRFMVPLLRRHFRPFAPAYNLPWAEIARELTARPLISVGGFRTGNQIRSAIEERGVDFVALCRPVLREPDFALKLAADPQYRSRCANCNRCAVMCDSGQPTRCYSRSAGIPVHSNLETSQAPSARLNHREPLRTGMSALRHVAERNL
jgi:2,4-dienoyl-CoA reductase-like NADH-dependent reductase (Old Yellow Enzyme family)